MGCCSGLQSGLYAPVPSQPHQLSKGPQENDGNLGSHSNFGVGHRNFTVWIKYFKFKIDSKIPLSPAYPTAQKAKLCFIAFLTPYVVESGVSCVTYLLSNVRNRLDVMSRVTGHIATGHSASVINPYPTAFPYGNGMVLHFYQQQESSTTKTVHKVINKGLKAYV